MAKTPSESQDPMDTWTDPTEIQVTSFTGTIHYSCCGLNQEASGDRSTNVSCQKCGTLYGLALLVSLRSRREPLFPKGTLVTLTRDVTVKLGSAAVTLFEGANYFATEDVYEVLNVPPGYQPVVIACEGERLRDMVGLVPEDCLKRDSPKIEK